MKRYLVLESVGKWDILIYRDGEILGTLYSCDSQIGCYEYLQKNVHPEDAEEKENLEALIQKYKFLKNLPKAQREAILYFHYNRDTKGFLIRLKDGWEWDQRVFEYVSPWNRKMALVQTTSELFKVMRHVQRI